MFERVSVLFVEDDAVARNTLMKILRAKGYDCITAENGEGGLELYRRNIPDIVLSDINMPVMNGLEMARAIRAEFYDAQIIFLSAISEGSLMEEAIASGFSRFIVKPVDVALLLAAILR